MEISHVTRLVISRLVPQFFDPLGGHIGPIKAQGKMLLSRGCQIAGAHQMKIPFVELDQTFGQQVFDWIQESRKIGQLKPLQRALIRGNEVVAGLICHVDGGKGGSG